MRQSKSKFVPDNSDGVSNTMVLYYGAIPHIDGALTSL